MLDVCLLGTGGMMPLPYRWLTALMTRYNAVSYTHLNENSLIVGKHQNTLEEMNEDAVAREHIHVVRRNTGGGAVYHDLGNVNFSFICSWATEEDQSYEHFLNPVIEALEKIGVHAKMNGRNDLTVDGRKISGNAQMVRDDRILHHGTLLFDSDLEKVQRVLKVSGEKLSSKGIKSVKSRVGNIKDYLPDPTVTVADFISHLKECILQTGDGTLLLKSEEVQDIQRLADEKYRTYEWNYGRSPRFNHRKTKRLSCGTVEVQYQVSKGKIEKCAICGDFLPLYPIEDVECRFLGVDYTKDDIYNILCGIELDKYFGCADAKELMTCFY